MLKLVWIPMSAGAPDSDDFKTAVDVLRDGGATGPVLQEFPKPRPFDPEAIGAGLASRIEGWARGKKRVVVMAHGYDFDPTDTVGGPDDDPFNRIFGVPGAVYGDPPQTVDRHNSWLPIVGERNEDGGEEQDLAIAFAWVSKDSFAQFARACWSNSYQYAALDLAPLAAKALASVLSCLCAKGIVVDIFAHSLGTRLTCQAIRLLRAGIDDRSIRRVILLGGAEYCVDAHAALSGRRFEVFNVVNREDKVLSWGAEAMCHPVRENGGDDARVIGREGLAADGNWLDIQIDRERAVAWLNGKGYPVSAFKENDIHAGAWLNHWVYYMNDDNRVFLRDLLAKPEMGISWFLDGGFPRGVDVPYYGRFNPRIPPTPQTAAARLELMAPSV